MYVCKHIRVMIKIPKDKHKKIQIKQLQYNTIKRRRRRKQNNNNKQIEKTTTKPHEEIPITNEILILRYKYTFAHILYFLLTMIQQQQIAVHDNDNKNKVKQTKQPFRGFST